MKPKTLALVIIAAGGIAIGYHQMHRASGDGYDSQSSSGSYLGQLTQMGSGGSGGGYQDASAGDSGSDPQSIVGQIQALSDRSTWVSSAINRVLRVVDGQ